MYWAQWSPGPSSQGATASHATRTDSKDAKIQKTHQKLEKKQAALISFSLMKIDEQRKMALIN